MSSEIYLENVVYEPKYQTYNLSIGIYIPLVSHEGSVNFSNQTTYLSVNVPVFSIDVDKFINASVNKPKNFVRIDIKSGYNQSANDNIPFYFELPVEVIRRIQQNTLKFPMISPLKLKSNLEFLPSEFQERYKERISDFINYYKSKYIPTGRKGFYARVPGLVFNEFSGHHVECHQRNILNNEQIFQDLESMTYKEKMDLQNSQGSLIRGYLFASEKKVNDEKSQLDVLIKCMVKDDYQSKIIQSKSKILEKARLDFKEKAERFHWKNFLINKDDLRKFYEDFCSVKSMKSQTVTDFYNSIYALIQLEEKFGN
jgi:hypothetical protein